TSVRGTALSPMTAASSGLGVLAAMKAAFGLRAGFLAAALAAGFFAAALAAGLRAAGFFAAAFFAGVRVAAAFFAGFFAATFFAATFFAGFFAAAFFAGLAATFLAAGLRATGFRAAVFFPAAAFFAAGLAATFFAADFLAAVFFAPLAVAMDHPPISGNDRLSITPRRMTWFEIVNNRNVAREQVLGTLRAQSVVSTIQSWRPRGATGGVAGGIRPPPTPST